MFVHVWHVCMLTYVCTYVWPYTVKFNWTNEIEVVVAMVISRLLYTGSSDYHDKEQYYTTVSAHKYS